MQRALIILGLASCCMARGFRPHKYLDRDERGLEHHSDLRIIGGSKAPVCLMLPHLACSASGLQLTRARGRWANFRGW